MVKPDRGVAGGDEPAGDPGAVVSGTFRPYHVGGYLRPHPETIWPAPCSVFGDPDEYGIAHTIRYGTPEQIAEVVLANRYRIAGIMESYDRLVMVPTAASQLPGLRAAIRNGEEL